MARQDIVVGRSTFDSSEVLTTNLFEPAKGGAPMTKRFSAIVVLTAALTFFGGCAVDSYNVIEHPEQVQPGATFEASFLNFVFVTSTGAVLVNEVNRDSLHLAMGFPDGWSVSNVRQYTADHLDLTSYFSLEEGEEQDSPLDNPELMALVTDSFPMYRTRSQPIPDAPDQVSFFESGEFDISDSAVVTLEGSSVAQWSAYSGFLGLSFPIGTEMDSVIALENLDTALISPGQEIDSLGYKVVPVFVFASVSAPAQERTDTLYYYAKTGPLPDLADTMQINLDLGDWAVQTVQITPDAAAGPLARYRSGGNEIQYRPDGGVTFSFSERKDYKIEVFSMNGTRLWTAAGIGAQAEWRGLNSRGRSIAPGNYLALVQTGDRVNSFRVQMPAR